VPGAGWAGNPYAYAGNDPLHALDPTGLRPATDADLKAYAAAHQGMVHAVGHWLSDNWEYVAGGAMVIAGGVLIATGAGSALGMMLVSAGADTIIQKATTGHVDWKETAVAGVAGGIGGAGLAARAGLTGIKAAVAAGAFSGGAGGGLTSGYAYMSGRVPHTVEGFATATAEGMAEGAVLGSAGGGVGHAIGGRIMGAMTHDASAGSMTMGRYMETRVIPYSEAHGYGYYKGTPTPIYNFMDRHVPASLADRANMWVNKKWINYQMMQGKQLVDIGMPTGTTSTGPYYGMELEQVKGYAGYVRDPQPANDLRVGAAR
jgi:hypothetical protein